MVSEAGASVYSASALAAAELPGMDVSLRGAVSIARRLQDPLAELVKIDPKSIGVGQYQHDVTASKLDRSLDAVVEDCVNAVGVDVNTASPALLSRVAGVGPLLSENIVAYRNEHGPFAKRSELKKVPRLGAKAFEQCAGFLRITGGAEPLDASSVHPEAYSVARKILVAAGSAPASSLDPPRLCGRDVWPAHGPGHPGRAGEARPGSAPCLRRCDVLRGHREDLRPQARHGARGDGNQRCRVRCVC